MKKQLLQFVPEILLTDMKNNTWQRSIMRARLIVGIFLLCGLFLPRLMVSAATVDTNPFPRKANYYLRWDIPVDQVASLAQWDVVILDMENQVFNPERIKQLRTLHPGIIILAYVSSHEVPQQGATSPGQLRRKLDAGLHPEWRLQNSAGKPYVYWPGNYMMNVSDLAPMKNGQQFNTYLATFVTKEILSTGLWDGIFFDSVWPAISWYTGSDVDLNGDGLKDVNINSHWQQGMKELFTKTRALAGRDIILVGNDHNHAYIAELNGKMIENFQQHPWPTVMGILKENQENTSFKSRINIINANTGNTGQRSSYQSFRFGLTSTLLENGYYSFDHGDQDHTQTWWYDEYDTNLGTPITNAISKQGYSTYQPDIWLRQFEHGLSLVNSTNNTQTITLGGEYEKIHGTQDTTVNDGSIVSEVTIDGYDGLLLLKTFSSLQDVLYPNGSFVRFFNAAGERTRNGLFVFEDGFKGGDQILRADLNGNGKKELVVATAKNRLLAWRDDGQPLLNVYPYTAMYPGKMVLAIGDLRADGSADIIVAPSVGYDLPIKVYNRFGWQSRPDWYPFHAGYKGGYHLAIGQISKKDISGKQYGSLIIGAGEGITPVVRVYDNYFQLQTEWLPFDANFRGGVPVAAGDVDGNGVDEIIIGAGKGMKPTVQVFGKTGTARGPAFSAYDTAGFPGVDVRAVDVDFDGKDDILAVSEGGL